MIFPSTRQDHFDYSDAHTNTVWRKHSMHPKCSKVVVVESILHCLETLLLNPLSSSAEMDVIWNWLTRFAVFVVIYTWHFYCTSTRLKRLQSMLRMTVASVTEAAAGELTV